MKIVKILFPWVFGFLFITTVSVLSNGIYNNRDSYRNTQISALIDKVRGLELNQNKTTQNVTQSLEKFQIRIWNVEDNIKLQNTFMKIQFEKYQDYYLKHWK